MTPAYAALGFREWSYDTDHYGTMPVDVLRDAPIAVQKLAVRLLEWACGVGDPDYDMSPSGVTEYHPRYKLVTEGRDWRAGKPDPRYSSCGDLAHWLLYRMGVRDWRVNRHELIEPDFETGGQLHNYKTGANVSNLTQWLPRAAPNVGTTLDAAPGDVLIIRGAPGTEHVICVIDAEDFDDRHMTLRMQTAEYGQPGGALRERLALLASTQHGRGLHVGGRRILYHIRLLDVLAEARAAGRLVAAEEPPA